MTASGAATASASSAPGVAVAFADWWSSVDRVALAAMSALLAAGLLCSMAASPSAADRFGIDAPFWFVMRQAVFAAASLGAIVVTSMFDPTRARRLAILALLACFVLLLITLFAGSETNAAKRWIRFGGYSLQPSEFAKPAFVVTAAWLLARGRETGAFAGAAIACAMLFAALATLLLLQPDFGQTVLLAGVLLGLTFLSGAPARVLAGLGALGGGIAAAAYFTQPHVAARVQAFFAPEPGYQTGLALEAIARGGLFGVGPGEGTVKHALPDAHTDFIFAVAAEEFGLLFTLGLIGLIGLVVVRILVRAAGERDEVRRLAAGGLALMIGAQALINLAVNLNLIPPKGMTLPFVSYGGSSLLALGLTGGLALAFTRRDPDRMPEGAGDAR
ncbi:MAG: putative peptidoglycan glycosyltransferase FtsW [Maricaulaceae bacterium]|jgi:cell division protein FtsW